ncbi:membrane dipeptidase [Clostridium sp. DSM 8431]|uniref:dipeptidase n=1 Tax=Clostridium sp. DSM 8431 TaxID=1761781 RepID=UPI0008E3E892|nr:dipeptidase [Clostridium sp. DSM 8431]SFU49190.1 membrane dipeptidase [Clostridium sp. DSM 8431]
MRYIDFHCDTAGRMLYENQGLKNNNFSVDINKMKKGNALAQVFALFIDAGEVKDTYLEFEKMYKNLILELKKNEEEIEIVTNINELSKAEKKGKMGAFISIEEGEVLKGNIENLKKVYDKGIRIITLTWNYKNKLGYPNYNYLYKDNGLTSTGIEIVKEMEDLGIVPDASHLSDGGFYDLVKTCKKPFIASHSNSRSITNHPRNLTDDMIKLLANRGGIMGINFCADFLGKNEVSSIEDMVSHIKHIKKVGGIDVISIGSDFDGIENEVEIKDASEIQKLENALIKEGFTYDEIEKIYYKNALRVLYETLK